MSTPPFLSRERSIGPSSGENFRNPKLRQFPEPARLRWKKFLGAGEDGFVVQARADASLVAVKFVRISPWRPALQLPTREQF
jgi:hypothetical protein